MALPQGYILLNRYRIVSSIKQGGMGAVYRAWDLNLKTPCAVKENLETSADAQRQFMQEAMMMAQLVHPNLPRIIDHFVIEETGQYLVMEFVEGQDLQELLDDRSSLTEDEMIPYLEQICDALSYLHNQPNPIIHRDVKPSNIKITPEGRAILVDFGIAKIFQTRGVTTQGARAITPGYSPPEQYGHGSTNNRTDIYALGATCYALLTGKEPPESVYRLATNATLPHPPGVSSHVANAILRAMALDPHHRFEDAAAFKKALHAPQSETRPAASLPKWAVPAAAVLLLAILAVLLAVRPKELTGEITPTAAGDSVTVVVVLPDNPPAQIADVATSEPTATESPPTITPTRLPPTPTPAPTVAYPIVQEIGRSYNNQIIEAYQFGDGSNAVLIVGGLHAGFAPSSVQLANNAIAEFSSDPLLIPANSTLYIIPNANPDSEDAPGEEAGRFNGNGVDPNRNFDCNWDSVAYWRDEPISPGTNPFSEPETQVLRDFVGEIAPVAVIFYEARATNGLVAPGVCDEQDSGSGVLAQLYIDRSAYPLYEGFSLTGDSADWLASQGVPAISILLTDYSFLSLGEWQRNLSAIQAVLRYYSE